MWSMHLQFMQEVFGDMLDIELSSEDEFWMKRVTFMETIGVILLWTMNLPIWLLTILAFLNGMNLLMSK